MKYLKILYYILLVSSLMFFVIGLLFVNSMSIDMLASYKIYSSICWLSYLFVSVFKLMMKEK